MVLVLLSIMGAEALYIAQYRGNLAKTMFLRDID